MVNHCISGFNFTEVGGVFAVDSADGQSFTYTAATISDAEYIIDDTDGDAFFDDQSTTSGQTYDPSELLVSIDGNTTGAGSDYNIFGSYDVTGSDGSTFTAHVFGEAPFPGFGNLKMAFTEQLDEGVTYTYSNYNLAGQVEWSELVKQGAAPCFCAGMKIVTARGEVSVEDLVPGDLVQTFDHGLQELKFVHSRQVRALGELVPVLFQKGAIGNTHDVMVSQKHRMFTGTLPNQVTRRFKGYNDHLIHAVALCNGSTIRLMPERKHVTYFHLMFENHEMVYCHGTVSESWQPTKGALKGAEQVAAELLAIFPELATRKSNAPGALVRHEIQLR